MKKIIIILFVLLIRVCFAQTHYTPAFIGKGLNHMIIYVVSATIGGQNLEAGDEIASFDGAICTGVFVLTQPIRITEFDTFAAIEASQKEGGDLNGYTTGNAITYKFWDKSKAKELSGITATYMDANTNLPTTAPTYSPSETVFVKLSVEATNQLPIADAGIDQSVNAGEVVTLNGTDSYDPDNDSLTYLWIAPAGVKLSSETTPIPTFVSPEVTGNVDYTFSLIVNDGIQSSTTDQVIIKVKQTYKPPSITSFTCAKINASAIVFVDITVNETNNIAGYYLVADNSIAPSAGLVGWLTDKPASITLETEGSHTLYLWVKDLAGNISQVSTVIVFYDKTAPVTHLSCMAVTNVPEVSVKIDVTEAGSGIAGYYLVADNSIAPSAGLVGWLTDKPASITLETEGSHTLYLWVKDLAGNVSQASTAGVSYTKTFNNAPEANAGLAQTVNEGQIVTLDGSKSFDPDGDQLNYHWNAPTGIVLSSGNIPNPTFLAPPVESKTEFIFTLLVTDSFLKSAQSSVIVTVNDDATSLPLQIKNERFLTALPNPFKNQVKIKIVNAYHKAVSVCIYNNSGILVYKSLNLPVIGNELTFFWDGNDSDGTPVPAGLYYLKADNQVLKLIKN